MSRSPAILIAFITAVAVLDGCKDDASSAAAAVTQAGELNDSGTKSTSISLPVSAAPARDGDLVLTVTTTAQVRSEAESKLKSEVQGTVDAVLVRPGDKVRRGQLLVRLDQRPFDLAVQSAQAAVDVARLVFQDSYVPDSIATGQGPSEERRKNSATRSGLARAQIDLEKAKLDRQQSLIVAPFDGVIDRVEVARGERVGAGQEITTVVDMQHLRIEAAVLEHYIPLIKPGGIAIVTSAAAPDRQVRGVVSAVLPTIDSVSRAGRAFIRLSGNGVLRPGMYADVRLEATRLKDRRLVPARAVIERDGRPLVMVVKDGRAQWTYITPGASNGVDTEVLPDSVTGVIPVAAGDLVITEGHLTLTHDAPVRVINEIKGEE